MCICIMYSVWSVVMLINLQRILVLTVLDQELRTEINPSRIFEILKIFELLSDGLLYLTQKAPTTTASLINELLHFLSTNDMIMSKV